MVPVLFLKIITSQYIVVNSYLSSVQVDELGLSRVCLHFDREQRVTGTIVFILVGLSAFMASVLKVMPADFLYFHKTKCIATN